MICENCKRESDDLMLLPVGYVGEKSGSRASYPSVLKELAIRRIHRPRR